MDLITFINDKVDEQLEAYAILEHMGYRIDFETMYLLGFDELLDFWKRCTDN